MKKLLSIILLLSITLISFGQDARHRTVDTIVADVLAAMPAQNAAVFAADMADLAASAPASVEALAKLYQAPEKGANNRIEYAINGLVTYVSDPAHQDKKADVLKGLQNAAAACSDPTGKAFFTAAQNNISPLEATAAQPALTAKAAKALLKNASANDKISATYAYLKADPSQVTKTVASALTSGDRKYANAVLTYADELVGSDAIVPAVKKAYAKLDDVAKTDVINWASRNGETSLLDLAKSALTSDNQELSDAATYAVANLGDADDVASLISQLGGKNDEAAYYALASFKNAPYKDQVVEALSSSDNAKQLTSLMELASRHEISAATPKMLELASSASDATVKDAARTYLKGVVGSKDITKVGALLDNIDNSGVSQLQEALKSAVRQLPASGKDEAITSLLKNAKNPGRLYTVLASSGSDKAVEDLAAAFNSGSTDALAGLLEIDNYKAAPVLFDIAKKTTDAGKLDSILKRYADLVNTNETDLAKKKFCFENALNLTDNSKTRNAILGDLQNVPTFKAFLLAGKYLDDENTAYAAANAVKKIANKSQDEMDYATLKTNLEKAAAVFKGTGDPDDEYAISEINQLLSDKEPSPISQLTDEEKKQGFEMLFDGTDLSKWQGDFEGYTPVNGAIYVSAGYGSTGNLYTKKEYKDFIYRFEFCLLKPGVNNGVGIRTPMGVDAAYDGMCEVQILDHDDPMYANLREYQVHGSVYGVIPAKRIVHKPLGEWETEEIEVRGTHIKVTVNGEVVVDGDVRKACKGHNVSPKEGEANPYTVDHRNHPGLFNKTGYISFCGHGEGLKLRNVRVLDLSK